MFTLQQLMIVALTVPEISCLWTATNSFEQVIRELFASNSFIPQIHRECSC